MSHAVIIKNAVKRYGDFTAVNGISLNIEQGEFFTLLGPSGCGKTTLLRMIAGFNTVDGGEICFDQQVINNLPAHKRDIGMVFQNYAIFPHMSVRKNVAFGLKNRRIAPDEIKRRTDEFLKLVHIEQYADQRPDQLSGGQQQRVALARALVVQPDVLLMDEPLSNLDAKLRVDMRTVIKRLQHDVGITTVYVTHDQEEAMAISDRIAVMKDGVIQHVGKPKDIYQRPSNLFVATFIGKSNLLKGTLLKQDGAYFLQFLNGYQVPFDQVKEDCPDNCQVIVAARPEELLVDHDGVVSRSSGPRPAGIKAVINDSVFLGLNTHYFVTLETGEEAEVIQESRIDSILEPGREIFLTVNTLKINVFSAQTGVSLMKGVRNEAEGTA